MSLLALGLIIIVIAVSCWAACRFIPMQPIFQKILVGVAVAVIVLICLHAFGVMDTLQSVEVPQVK